MGLTWLCYILSTYVLRVEATKVKKIISVGTRYASAKMPYVILKKMKYN